MKYAAAIALALLLGGCVVPDDGTPGPVTTASATSTEASAARREAERACSAQGRQVEQRSDGAAAADYRCQTGR